MTQTQTWHVDNETGFLFSNTLQHLSESDTEPPFDTITTLEQIAQDLPKITPAQLADMPTYDFSQLPDDATNLLERLWLMYGYFTNKYLFGGNYTTVPASIATPFMQLTSMVQRPLILSYVGMVLTNWRKHNNEPVTPYNVDVSLKLTNLPDEAGFFRVHIAIEAQAGAIIEALRAAKQAIADEDDNAVLETLRTVRAGLVQITSTFHEMPNVCDSDVYFHKVRPYLFGYNNIIFEGVSSQPLTLRGGSGAQSSVIPAILGGMGVSHAQTALTSYLNEIRSYMPREHRNLIDEMHTIPLRRYCAERPPLRDAYNNALRQLTTFRRAHLYYARTYIFEKSLSTTGTGGTDYLSFLGKLIDETAAQQL